MTDFAKNTCLFTLPNHHRPLHSQKKNNPHITHVHLNIHDIAVNPITKIRAQITLHPFPTHVLETQLATHPKRSIASLGNPCPRHYETKPIPGAGARPPLPGNPPRRPVLSPPSQRGGLLATCRTRGESPLNFHRASRRGGRCVERVALEFRMVRFLRGGGRRRWYY